MLPVPSYTAVVRRLCETLAVINRRVNNFPQVPLQQGLDMAAIEAGVACLCTFVFVCVCVCDESPDLPMSPAADQYKVNTSLYLQHHLSASAASLPSLCAKTRPLPRPSIRPSVNPPPPLYHSNTVAEQVLQSEAESILSILKSPVTTTTITEASHIYRKKTNSGVRSHSLVCKPRLFPSPPQSPCAAEGTSRRWSRTENTYSRRDDKWRRIQMRLLLPLQLQAEEEQHSAVHVTLKLLMTECVF